RRRSRRDRVHDRRRNRRSSWNRELRGSVHLVQAARRHPRLHDSAQRREGFRSHWNDRHQRARQGMDQLVVALDVDTVADARALADRLRGIAGGFKIGNRLFTSEGPAIVEELAGRGDRVFLDLKFHDIPTTVAGAVAAATRLGIWMLNVHASGGGAMMRAARDAAREEAARMSRPAPLVIAVTMLTSLDQQALTDIGMTDAMTAQVGRLAALTEASGLDGVVASPHEIDIVRRRCGRQFAIVTPGIR